MKKYFPAAPSREKNPSYSKIKPLQSKAPTAVQPALIRSQEVNLEAVRSMRRDNKEPKQKKSDRQSVSSHKHHHSNVAINGKEMSTARLISRIHQNLQSLEAMIEDLCE